LQLQQQPLSNTSFGYSFLAFFGLEQWPPHADVRYAPPYGVIGLRYESPPFDPHTYLEGFDPIASHLREIERENCSISLVAQSWGSTGVFPVLLPQQLDKSRANP